MSGPICKISDQKKYLKDVCPVSNNEKLFPALEGDNTMRENALKIIFREIGWMFKTNLEMSNLFHFCPYNLLKECEKLSTTLKDYL